MDYEDLLRGIDAIGDLINEVQSDEAWPSRSEVLDELVITQARMLGLLAQAGPSTPS
jgi:hypothetical protein